jgi:hypothetical protein
MSHTSETQNIKFLAYHVNTFFLFFAFEFTDTTRLHNLEKLLTQPAAHFHRLLPGCNTLIITPSKTEKMAPFPPRKSKTALGFCRAAATDFHDPIEVP